MVCIGTKIGDSLIEKTRHDERKAKKLARVSRKVLTFAADFENEMKKHD
jgi:hypothetical protein